MFFFLLKTNGCYKSNFYCWEEHTNQNLNRTKVIKIIFTPVSNKHGSVILIFYIFSEASATPVDGSAARAEVSNDGDRYCIERTVGDIYRSPHTSSTLPSSESQGNELTYFMSEQIGVNLTSKETFGRSKAE
jgi:hypothetical protein